MKKILLATELVLLFVALPLIFYFDIIPVPKSILLFAGFAYCLTILLRDTTFEKKQLVATRIKGLRFILLRFAATALLLTAYLLVFEPENLLIIPTQMPWLWVGIMVFYPIWSALPQELIFRVFFFHRYRDLFTNFNLMVILNAFLFAFMHIIFNNWVALVGGFIVGLFWAQTYIKTRSLLTVSTEHAVYGNFIYTIGLGHYFYVPDY